MAKRHDHDAEATPPCWWPRRTCVPKWSELDVPGGPLSKPANRIPILSARKQPRGSWPPRPSGSRIDGEGEPRLPMARAPAALVDASSYMAVPRPPSVIRSSSRSRSSSTARAARSIKGRAERSDRRCRRARGRLRRHRLRGRRREWGAAGQGRRVQIRAAVAAEAAGGAHCGHHGARAAGARFGRDPDNAHPRRSDRIRSRRALRSPCDWSLPGSCGTSSPTRRSRRSPARAAPPSPGPRSRPYPELLGDLRRELGDKSQLMALTFAPSAIDPHRHHDRDGVCT